MITRLHTLKMYLEIAKITASNSRCRRLKVGAVIVLEDKIISTGYNHMPQGFPQACELIDGSTNQFVIHAEAHAILDLLKFGPSPIGADLVTTHSPCVDCAKLIVQSGIKRVFYGEPYRCDLSHKLLETAGVKLEKILG